MLGRRKGLLAAFAVAAVFVATPVAQSQPSPSGEQKQEAEEPNTQSAPADKADKGGITGEKYQRKAGAQDQKRAKRSEKGMLAAAKLRLGKVIAWFERYGIAVQAFATLAIAVFSLVLAISTWFLWRATDKAANAAKRAAEHIPTVERAWVFGLPMFSRDGSGIDSVQLGIKNHGKTPAFIKVICMEWVSEQPLNPIPSYQGREQVQIILSAGDTEAYHARKILLSTEYLVGYIRYVDIFKNTHISRFCFRVLPDQERFEMAGHPNWNGHTTEKPE